MIYVVRVYGQWQNEDGVTFFKDYTVEASNEDLASEIAFELFDNEQCGFGEEAMDTEILSFSEKGT